MKSKYIPVTILISCALSRSFAETTRLPFFAPPAVHTESAQAFPAFASWMEFSHTLNQESASDTAQYLDTGSIMTFWSNDLVAISGIAREILQFRASPEGDWYFWTRAFVTDLGLEAAFSLEPFEVTAIYRHDCKHDAGPVVRDVIHDTLGARVGVPVSPVARFGLEFAANLPTVFQAGPEESDRFRVSAEAELVPFEAADGAWHTFIDGRGSFIVRERGERVAVTSTRDFDWYARAGAEYRAGLGRVRLFYGLERIGDDWADLDPSPEVISAVHLMFVFYGTNIGLIEPSFPYVSSAVFTQRRWSRPESEAS